LNGDVLFEVDASSIFGIRVNGGLINL